MPALGVCYYPEHWPEDLWPRDAARMVETGITFVRIGEFAWSRLEPQPGRFDWGWLDRAIEVLAEAGLKVVLGTPSATPPRWMLERFPDMLAVDQQGRPRKFGSRRHYCHAHDGYREAAAAMARRMGERYGRDPRIAAWQIDNEYGCHDTVLSYSNAARRSFRDWLARKYQSPQALNRAWGTVFWSMEYDDFSQIDLPNLTVTQASPAHELDFRRFASDTVVAWNAAQVAALRPLTDAPLLHNYMGRVTDFDHFALGRDLDIASWDSYPIGFLSDRLEATPAHRAAFLQQGDPDFQAFHHDLYRAVGRGRWWVMEQQPGPVNWAPWNPAPLPGMVRLWGLEAVAHGAEVVSYFRWRQAPFAQEQYHAGLLYADDTEAPGLAEAAALARDMAALPDAPAPRGQAALVFDYASDWMWKVLPQGADFDYFRLVFSAYRALRRAGLSVDILPPDATDFEGYRVILAPGLGVMPEGLAEAMAAAPGAALCGPRCNLSDANHGTRLPPGPALPGLDVTVRRVESLPPELARPVAGGGTVRHWFEEVEGSAPVRIALAEGRPLLSGDDTLCYLSGWPDDRLWDQVLITLGIDDPRLPDGLRIRDTATHRFIINYAPYPQDWLGATVSGCDVLVQLLPESGHRL